MQGRRELTPRRVACTRCSQRGPHRATELRRPRRVPHRPTPFLDDGTIDIDIDIDSVDRLTDFYLGCGATGITVLGRLGEAPKLAHAESVDVATRMIRRAQTLPVIVGVSAPGFAAMRALTREVMDRGAAGVMIAPPNTLRTDDQSVRKYLLHRRGLLKSPALRAPKAPLTAAAQAEVEHLLRRLARHDPRAAL